MILRLYNLTWLHFELCTELFTITKVVTHHKLFGQYLHALVVHAPPQYEIVCMKFCTQRVRTDYLDRQNRWRNQQQTNSIIPNILLRLQAKQVRGDLFKAVAAKSSKFPFRQGNYCQLPTLALLLSLLLDALVVGSHIYSNLTLPFTWERSVVADNTQWLQVL